MFSRTAAQPRMGNSQYAFKGAMPSMVKDPLAAARETQNSSIISIESRFGPISVNLQNALFFPNGLLGLDQYKDFALVEMPNPKFQQFKLLQSLNDKDLSFVVLPVDPDSGLIASDDLDECCKATGVRKEYMVVLLITTVHRKPGEVKLTVNMRAPLVVDSEGKAGIQYVFPNNKYQITYALN